VSTASAPFVITLNPTLGKYCAVIHTHYAIKISQLNFMNLSVSVLHVDVGVSRAASIRVAQNNPTGAEHPDAVQAAQLTGLIALGQGEKLLAIRLERKCSNQRLAPFLFENYFPRCCTADAEYDQATQ
jgi:hypothetical protein